MVKIRTLLLSLAVATALAGTAWAVPVQVFPTWARGDMGTAHNTVGFIGCWIDTDPIGPPLLYCEANDGAGNDNFCMTTNPVMMSVAQSMTTVAEIEFGWDGAHGCTWITISNFSQPPGRRS
jgi:hypothetical protein